MSTAIVNNPGDDSSDDDFVAAMLNLFAPDDDLPDTESGLVLISIDRIRPAPENDLIYRATSDEDPEIVALADSIISIGLKEPIVVTIDGWILSGHRRFAACRLAGLREVTVRIEPIRRRDDIDAFTKLLAEYNRQRVKTRDEKLREEVLAIDPEDAHAALVKYRNNAAAVKAPVMNIGGEKRRAEISPAKRYFLQAVLKVLRDYEDYLPISERKVHYTLLNDPPLIHASKPTSRYKNDRNSSKALSDLVTRARVAGIIPFDAICDETRPIELWNTHNDVGSFLRAECKSMFCDFWRNLLQSQSPHIELFLEKNTLLPIVKNVAAEYTIPITSGRGFCSVPPKYEIAKRLKASGKQKLVVIIMTDFDPPGMNICDSFARTMRDEHEINDIACVRAGLNKSHIKRFKLSHPLDITEKGDETTWGKFQKRYGNDGYELEALEPTDLQLVLREAIDGVIDHDAFQHEVDQERNDAVYIAGVRRQVLSALKEMQLDIGDDESEND